jgi:hypothetical protein
MYGLEGLVKELGPSGRKVLDDTFAAKLLTDSNGAQQLAGWLGSKGWNSTGGKSGKLQPHLPPLLIESWFETHTHPGRVLKPLLDWLKAIVSKASLAPV